MSSYLFAFFSVFLAYISTSLTKTSPDAFYPLASSEIALARPAAGSSLLRVGCLEVDGVVMDWAISIFFSSWRRTSSSIDWIEMEGASSTDPAYQCSSIELWIIRALETTPGTPVSVFESRYRTSSWLHPHLSGANYRKRHAWWKVHEQLFSTGLFLLAWSRPRS